MGNDVRSNGVPPISENEYFQMQETLHNYILERVHEALNEQRDMKYGRDATGVFLIERSVSPELYAKIRKEIL